MAPNPSHPGQYAPAPAGATPPYQQAADGYGLAPAPPPAPAPSSPPAPAPSAEPILVGPPPVTFSGPLRAIGSYLINFFNFTKPATRSQYWWIAIIFIAAPVVVFYIVYSLPAFDVVETTSRDNKMYGVKTLFFWVMGVGVATLAALVTYFIGILARLSLQVRRLRDGGFSPWWALLSLGVIGDIILTAALTSMGLPSIAILWSATIVVEILCLAPSKRAGNRYLRYRTITQPANYTPNLAPATH